MGWCTHPRRRIGADVRIYVRGQELPCRNDWANDLWQQADASGADTDIVIDAAAGPVRPATPDEISILAAIDQRAKPDTAASDAAARGEDVVVGEVTASIAAGEMSHSGQERQSLRRAHEEMKTRKRETRTGLPPVIDDAGLTLHASDDAWPVLNRALEMDAANDPPRSRERIAPHPTLANGEVSPVALGEIGRPFPKMTTFPEDDARFSSIPVVDDAFELPLARQAAAPRIVGRAGFDDDHAAPGWTPRETAPEVVRLDDDAPVFEEVPSLADDDAVEMPRIELDTRLQAPAQRRKLIGRPKPRPERQPLEPTIDVLADLYAEPELAPYLDEAERTYDAAARRTVVEPAEAEVAALDLNDLLDGIDAEQQGHDYAYVQPEKRRGMWGRRHVTRRPVEQTPVEFEFAGDDGYAAERDDAFVPAGAADPIDDRYHHAQTVDDVIVTPRPVVEEIAAAEPPLWSAIPRACRTCRDFRPAESGERGWCTNKWAFSHRRMVDADELPCETSIGGWWLPHDESWMTGVDITAHSQPTPLLDQWLALRAAANGEYNDAAPIRRRQRS